MVAATYPKQFSLAGPAPLAPQHRVWWAAAKRFIEPASGIYTVHSAEEEAVLLAAIPRGIYPADPPEFAAMNPAKPDPSTGWHTPSTAARLAHRQLLPVANEAQRAPGVQ